MEKNMTDFENSDYLGEFTIEPGKQINGKLKLGGTQSYLYLWDHNFFSWGDRRSRFVHGVLNDLRSVSLIDCITPKIANTYARASQTNKKFSAKVYPHYAVFGEQHLSPTEESIVEISFCIDDAGTLFNDFDAFGCIFDPPVDPLMKQIVQHQEKTRQRYKDNRKIEIGPRPHITYFTGKNEIFSVDTVYGNISALHCPTHSFGDSSGVKIENTIFVHLRLSTPVIFMDAIDSVFRIVEYLGLLVGRPQNIQRLIIYKKENLERPNPFNVYGCGFPKYKRSQSEEGAPQVLDILIDAIQCPNQFSRILANWLERSVSWRDARGRFFNNFNEEEKYSVDRLIGAANAFDILPDSAGPDRIPLAEDIQSAHYKCRNIFKKLPFSPERDSVLSALGRIGKSTLKRKIRHRAQLLIDADEDMFSDLCIVTDEAVNCRNHYVHGSPSRIDYNKEPTMQVFLTETLEFVFAASDLIEAGWNIKGWKGRGSGITHPLDIYWSNYKIHLDRLKTLLAEGEQ